MSNHRARSRWRGVVAALLGLTLAGCSEDRPPAACRDALKDVTQLVVVATDTMDSANAEITLLRRAGSASQHSWQVIEPSFPAVVGRAGLGWGHAFDGLRRAGEVHKVEGDKRTPAGVFPLGKTFGFEAADWPGHLALKSNHHICVDDLGSPYYGQIVSRSVAGPETRGEEMAAIPVYKRGIVVNYPSNAAKKSGSCIFFHIWQQKGEGTVGCIAAAEAHVAHLQNFSVLEKTSVIIWAKSAATRLQSCLQGLPEGVFQRAGKT